MRYQIKHLPSGEVIAIGEEEIKVGNTVIHERGWIGKVREEKYNDAPEVQVDWFGVQENITASRTSLIYLKKLLYSSNPDRGLTCIDLEELKKGDDVEELANNYAENCRPFEIECKGSFKDGYNTSKDMFPYSEEQMLKWAGYYYKRETARPDLTQMDIWREWKLSINQLPNWIEVEMECVGNVTCSKHGYNMSNADCDKQPKLYSKGGRNYVKILDFGSKEKK
jgi:hypothetical protein